MHATREAIGDAFCDCRCAYHGRHHKEASMPTFKHAGAVMIAAAFVLAVAVTPRTRGAVAAAALAEAVVSAAGFAGGGAGFRGAGFAGGRAGFVGGPGRAHISHPIAGVGRPGYAVPDTGGPAMAIGRDLPWARQRSERASHTAPMDTMAGITTLTATRTNHTLRRTRSRNAHSASGPTIRRARRMSCARACASCRSRGRWTARPHSESPLKPLLRPRR